MVSAMATNDLQRPADDEERMAIARRLAGWELGYPAWADRLISVYFSPNATTEYLDRVQGKRP